MAKNREKSIENLIPFKKGESGNPNGRPEGQRNYATIYKEALQILADQNATTPEKLEAEMTANAAVLARKGDYRFYKDIMDRLHGTATSKLDVTTGGDKITQEFTKEEQDKLLALLE